MMTNQFEDSYRRRHTKLVKRLRPARNPLSDAEGTIENLAQDIIQNYEWNSRNPFPKAPPGADYDESKRQRAKAQ